MKAKELQKKPSTQLQKLLQKNREKLRELRFDLAAGKLKKVSEIKKTKREIARILTIIKEHA